MLKTNRTKFNPVTLDHPVNHGIALEQIVVDPEMAREMLAHNENNRNLRPAVVSSYARDMVNGDWMPTAETVKFDWHGRLIDGQHRLHAVIEAATPVPLTVARGLQPEAQTVLDMGARRTASDALAWNGLKVYNTTIAAVARLATAYDAGVIKNAASDVSVKVTNSEVLSWVERNPLVTEAAALAHQVSPGIGSTPSPTAFVALKFMELDVDDAIEFLRSTAEFKTEGRNDPRATLIATFNRMSRERSRPRPATQISMFFRAWNAWREGRSITKLPLESVHSGGVKPVSIPEPK